MILPYIDKVLSLDDDLQLYSLSTKVKNSLKKMNINTLEELMKYDLEDINNFKGIGNATYIEIKKLYNYIKQIENYTFKSELADNILLSSIFRDDCFFENKLEEIKKIEVLVSSKSKNKIFSEYHTIAAIIMLKNELDLEEYDLTNINLLLRFIDDNANENIEDIVDIVSPKYAKFKSIEALEEYIDDFLYQIGERNYEIIKYRFGIGCKPSTLEEVGIKYGTTRERVRQVEASTLRKLREEIRQNIIKICNTLIKDYYIVEKYDMLRLILLNINDDDYFKDYEGIKLNIKYYYKFIEEKIKLEMILNNEYYYDLNTKIIKLDDELIKYLYKENYSNEYNKVCIKITNKVAIPLIVKAIGKTLCLNYREDIDYIVKKAKENYNIIIDGGQNRNIERVLLEKTILWGPRTYIHPDNIRKINSMLLNKIFNNINTKQMTSSNDLYNKFKFELREYDIMNSTALYGYLKFFFGKNFNFGGLSGVISIKGEESSWSAKVKKIMQQRKCPIIKSELKSIYPALTDVIFSNMVVNDDNIIGWGYNVLYLKELINITEKEKFEILQYIVQNKTIYLTSLYSYLLINNYELIKRNYISDDKTLRSFLKEVYPNKFEYREQEKLVCYFT